MRAELDHNQYYRLPWNLADNSISWLEPTWQCNMYCKGCYRQNTLNSHKTVDEVRKELETFKRLRKSDSISIAGGEPLIHPDILEIVRITKEMGFKPIVNSNGMALNRELLRKLIDAGVYGFTFHVDSKQTRKDWRGKNELELNQLRYDLAKMVAEESKGSVSVAFNSTIFEDTLEFVPPLVEWAQDNIDIVHSMVFILYRAMDMTGEFEYWAGNKKIEIEKNVVYNSKDEKKEDLITQDVVGEIRKTIPDYQPCAYLNGSEKPDSFKWLISGRIGNKKKIFGWAGPKWMELVQFYNHFRKGTYVAYEDPKMLRKAVLYMALLWPFEKSMRKMFGQYLKYLLTNPLGIFQQVHYQSIGVIQPIDFLTDGRQNMCDGCPDMTVINGELGWSCRLEEPYKYGTFVRTIPAHADKKHETHQTASGASTVTSNK